MFSFTKQERLVLFFLVLIIFCGSLCQFVLVRYPDWRTTLRFLGKERVIFQRDVNAATTEELDAIPYLGPATADKIVAYRRRVGEIQTLDEIAQLPGISAKSFVKFKPYLTIRE